MSIRVPGAHFEGPILGSATAGGGLFDDMPAELVAAQRASVLFQDYTAAVDEADWVVTNITSGTADTVPGLLNGVFRLTATTANQGLGSVQLTDADGAGEGIATPTADEVIVFEARVTCDDWSDCDWFIGLGEIDTTFMSNAGALLATGADNHAGFHHLLADAGSPDLSVAGTALANLENVTQYAGSRGTVGNELVDSTYYRFGIRIEGVDKVRFYLDGRAISDWHAMGTDYADGLVPTFTMVANGSAILFDVDYLTVAFTR